VYELRSCASAEVPVLIEISDELLVCRICIETYPGS
jgi:hypothetical protein